MAPSTLRHKLLLVPQQNRVNIKQNNKLGSQKCHEQQLVGFLPVFLFFFSLLPAPESTAGGRICTLIPKMMVIKNLSLHKQMQIN